MDGPSAPRKTVQQRETELKDYWGNYSQWLYDTQKGFEKSRSLSKAKMAAGGLQAGSELWNQQMQGAEEEFTKQMEELRSGQHYQELKEQWTKGFGQRNFGQSADVASEHYTPSGSMQVAKERVEKRLMDEGYERRTRKVRELDSEGAYSLKEVGYWGRGEGVLKDEQLFEDDDSGFYSKKNEVAPDVYDEKNYRSEIEKEAKALAGDETAMLQWFESQYGGPEYTEDNGADDMAIAKSAAGGAKRPAAGGTEEPELAWSLASGPKLGADAWL